MSNDRTAEILRYLSAISVDVGELRHEVKAVTARLERVEERIEQVEGRLEQVEIEVKAVRSEVKVVGVNLARLEARISDLRVDKLEMDIRVATLEGKIVRQT